MAIACGINDGLGLGENSKAALILQGVEEIKLLAEALGEQNPQTDNPASFGDIFLTCSTTKSRNNSLGSKIGQGEKYSDLKKTKTYEGAINAESVNRLATKLDIELKLCQTVCNILEGEFGVEEVKKRVVEVICS